ncbi:rust resistance kinase Lr10-like [Macadamia integrifolia]|uniref:rust resistance kinase Lr10-like n=1 Tax=Macadamia integrifolia TaxID=60698 RepID=UPI001C4F467E|nr:rust resistance kinase Lr10-like [Macadamia integrifolia]
MAYNPLFSCGPISKPNYFEPVPASVIFPVDSIVGTHFNCTRAIPAGALRGLQNASCLGCLGQDPNNVCYYAPGLQAAYQNCETYDMYTKRDFNVSAEKDLRGYLQRGFEMRYTKPTECRGCEATGGRCGVNPSSSTESFVCFCPSTIHSFNCSDGLLVELDGAPMKGQTQKLAIGLGIGLGAGLILFIGIVGYFHFKKRWNKNNQGEFDGEDDEALRFYLEGDKTIPASIETFLENYTLGRPTRFSYKQLKRYTNNFAHRLGQGGHGSVFKGKLPSGLFVAVKLLNDTDQSEAQFVNEVRVIGQIRHNHLVRLLGYCIEHSRKVLVYEFMENGSLDKYIHVGDSQKTEEKLSWSQLHDIAVGTAKGIMYLHEDCRSRIIHCDIKPHNILLDRNFRPKVSDFGLALVMNRDKSHVSISHGAGTPGYAPPEMWWMNCGMVSEKSDVYSFGMVMLEVAGRRRNLVTDVSSSSEKYFSEWVFLHNAVNPSNSGEERGIVKRMELVALLCIQFEQSKRPSMRRVIEMLEGDVVIEIPPAPFNPHTLSNI